MLQVVLFNVTNGLIIGAFYVLMALGLSLCCFALGWLTVPFSGVGITLGTIGLVVPLVAKRSGVILPACGIAANAVALLVVLVGHLLGMSLFGLPEDGDVHANDLHMLFIPVTIFYGLAFILVLWTRLGSERSEVTLKLVRWSFFVDIP